MQQIPASLNDMTLREKIGQMMFPAFRTNSLAQPLRLLDEVTKEQLRTWKPGGVVLFAQNMETVPQTAAFVRALQAEAGIPLFIGVDEEGGKVSRLSAAPAIGAVTMPPALDIGATGDVELAREAAEATGRQLAVLGFNLDFAPDADINTNPQNPVIGNRAYGTEPAAVSAMVTAAAAGLDAAGIVPVVKHFPGHGDTQTDSHVGLAVVPHDRARMDAIELVPFKAAITAGIPFIMTAHVNTPGISKRNLPATLNPDILTDLLRKELGFNGLITTDAMEMGAITENYGEEESIVMAVEAGVDMLLVPVSLERACLALEAAVSTGRISEARIDESVQRIFALKRERGLVEQTAAFMKTQPTALTDGDQYRNLVERIRTAGK